MTEKENYCKQKLLQSPKKTFTGNCKNTGFSHTPFVETKTGMDSHPPFCLTRWDLYYMLEGFSPAVSMASPSPFVAGAAHLSRGVGSEVQPFPYIPPSCTEKCLPEYQNFTACSDDEEPARR